jgi:hypothetical protein
MANTSDESTSEPVPSQEKQESDPELLARRVEEAKAATRRSVATATLGVEWFRQLLLEVERELQDDPEAHRSLQKWLKKNASEMAEIEEQSRERLRRLCLTSERIAAKQAASKQNDSEQ